MNLNEQYKNFLVKRRRFAKSWPLVGILLLLGIFAFLIWLFLRNPLLVNPFEVASRLEAGTIEKSTLVLMAGMLPIMFLACFFILLVMVLFAFAVFSNEKKYIKIIDLLLHKETEKMS